MIFKVGGVVTSALLLGILLELQAQIPGARADFVTNSSGCSFEGIVMEDTPQKQPVADAMVRLNSDDFGDVEQSIRTGPDGKFCFKNVALGRYRLSAVKPGFALIQFGSAGPNRPGTAKYLRSGTSISGLEVRLPRTASIAGAVLDKNGSAIRGVFVDIARTQRFRGRNGAVLLGTRISDQQGRFLFDHLLPGQYSVRFRNEVHVQAEPSDCLIKEAFKTVYYGGSPAVAGAVSVSVHSGEALMLPKVELEKEPAPCLRVEIRPKGADTTLSVIQTQGDESLGVFGTPVSSSSGRYVVSGLTKGSLVAAIGAVAGGGSLIGYVESRVSAEDEQTVKMDLPQRQRLYITPVVIGSDPNRSTRLSGNISVSVEPRYSANDTHIRSFPIESTAEIHPLVSGEYYLNITAVPDGTYVEQISLDGVLGYDRQLFLRDGEFEHVLKIHLGTDGGKIQGTVKTERARTKAGEVAPPIMVVAVPFASRANPESFKLTQTDESGGFLLNSLRPGAYTIYAIQDPEFGAESDDGVLRSLTGTRCDVIANGSSILSLTAQMVQ